MCDSEYEYEPQGIFGTGSGSALQHVEGEDPRPLGFLAALQRQKEKEPCRFVRVDRSASSVRTSAPKSTQGSPSAKR